MDTIKLVSWSKNALFYVGMLLVCLAVEVILGWHLQNTFMARIFPNSLPMQYNTSLFFLITGLAFIAHSTLKVPYLVSLMGFLISLLSTLTIFQDLFSFNFNIDELLIFDTLSNNPRPGRQASITSLSFIFTGIGLVLMDSTYRLKLRPLLLGLIGAFILAVSIVICIGYISGLEAMYKWSNENRMPLLTSIGMLLIGIGFLSHLSWLLSQDIYKSFSIWFSLPVGVCAITTILFVWFSLKTHDVMRLQEAEFMEVTQIKTTLLEKIEDIVQDLTLATGYIEKSKVLLESKEKKQLLESAVQVTGFHNLFLLDKQEVNGFSLLDNRIEIRDPMQNELIVKALEIKSPVLSFLENAFGINQSALFIYIPLFHSDRFEGTVIAIFNLYKVFNPLLKDYDSQTYSISVYDNSRMVYLQDSTNNLKTQKDALKVPLDLYNLHWTVQAISIFGFLAQHQNQVHILSLIESILMGALVLIAMHFAQTTRLRSKELEASLSLLKAAQTRLVTQEKLASLGALTAGIAHEIKNPLNFINSFTSLSLNLLPSMEKSIASLTLSSSQPDKQELLDNMLTLKNNVDTIHKHTKRVNSIIERMMAHSIIKNDNRQSTNLHTLLEDALKGFSKNISALYPNLPIEIDKKYDPHMENVIISVDEIMQVLQNLLQNASYSLAQKKQDTKGFFTPHIEIKTEKLKDKVEIRIKDNGTGIPAKYAAKIFTPFFTTKPPGQGVGLGLSLCHDIIVQKHHGLISYQTKEDEFTEFVITLPKG